MTDGVSEKQLLEAILRLAAMFSWRAYHTFDSRRSAPGFPDLCLIKAPRVIFAELKSERGTLTAAQEAWIAELRQCPGVETHVWYPADFDAIVACLREGRAR